MNNNAQKTLTQKSNTSKLILIKPKYIKTNILKQMTHNTVIYLISS